MIFSRFSKISLLAFSFLPVTLFASDFTYQETTQMTGGSMLSMIKMAGAFSSQARKAGEPTVSTIYLKDNRMAKVTNDGIEIIDLDKETITHIDLQKHSYYTQTFQQIRDQAAAAEQQAAKSQPAPKASEPVQKNPDNVKMSFDVKVRNTGASKVVTGLPANEAILSMVMNATDTTTNQQGAMAITNDMWMVPEIPGYKQVGEFYARMAAKMAAGSPNAPGVDPTIAMDTARMLAQHPGATLALTDMAKEMQKLKGVPIMQVMRMGTTTDGKPLAAASEAPLPASNTPSGGDMAKQGAASMLASKIPFGFGRKKNDQSNDQSQNQNQNPNAPPPTSAVLMETQITTSAFSSAPVDPSHFEVPAGYKQNQPPSMR